MASSTMQPTRSLCACSKPLMTCRPPAPPTVTPTPRKGTIAVHQRCPSRMWSTACRDDGAGVRGKTTTQGCARSQARMVVVSNLSARQPCDAVRSRMSPRLVSADELGRCGAKHGAGEQRVGAALASHGRGHRFETCHAHQHKRSSDSPNPPSLSANHGECEASHFLAV